jgi:hypothetical protein
LLILSRKREEGAEDGEHPAWANCHAHRPKAGSDEDPSAAELIKVCESPRGRPLLGKLYQVLEGDSPLTVARKALFGSDEPRLDPRERQAVIDLSIRVDCGPWNQTVNSRPKSMLGPGHYAVDRAYTSKGVAYQPVFPDNRGRLLAGQAPLVGQGNSFPFIWVPMIDLDRFMTTGEVTTLGQDYPDDGDGSYNMIDPPPWVINLQFEGELQAGAVGCALPDGDFSKLIEFDDG